MGLLTDRIETTAGANSFYTDEDGNLVVGSVAQTFVSDAENEFGTPEANVEWSTDKWQNKQDDLIASITASGTSTYTSYTANKATDGMININDQWVANGAVPQTLTFSLSASRVVTSYQIWFQSGYNATAWTFQGSNDNWSTNVVLDTVSGNSVSQAGLTRTFANATSYAAYRWVFSAANGGPNMSVMEAKLFSVSSTNNKITTLDIVNSGPALSFDPSATLFKTLSSGGTDVTDNIAIEYSRDNQSTWHGPYTAAQFQALNASLFADCDYMHLRFQLTGAQTLGYVRMSSTSSTITLGTNATFEIKLAGGTTFAVSALGAVLASGQMKADAFVGGQVSIASTDSPYTVTEDSTTVLINASAGNVTAVLPTAVGIKGRRFTFVSVAAHGGNSITIDGNGDETINGAATYTGISAQWGKVTVESDDTNWIIV